MPIGTVTAVSVEPSVAHLAMRGRVSAIEREGSVVRVTFPDRAITLRFSGDPVPLPLSIGDELAWDVACAEGPWGATCEVAAHDAQGLVLAVTNAEASGLTPTVHASRGPAMTVEDGACGRTELDEVELELDGGHVTIAQWGGWTPLDLAGVTGPPRRYWISASASRVVEGGCVDQPTAAFRLVLLRERN